MPVDNPAQELKDEIAANYPVASDIAIVQALNTSNLTGKKKIPIAEIQAYLFGVDKWLGIEESTTDAGKKARYGLVKLPHVDRSIAAFDATFTQLLDDLITAGLIDAGDKTALLALGETSESWAYQKFGRPVKVKDVRDARALS